jgi:hypothetical protein
MLLVISTTSNMHGANIKLSVWPIFETSTFAVNFCNIEEIVALDKHISWVTVNFHMISKK